MENIESQEKTENILENLVEGGSDFKFTDLESHILKKMRHKMDLKLFVKMFIESEREKIRKHIRLLKKTNSFYEELNRDLSSAKSEADIVNILGDDSELVKEWRRISGPLSDLQNDGNPSGDK